MNLFQAFILGLVEGFTEFLPISSTGHLILVSRLLGIEETEFLKSFEILIQLGAISAVVFLYGRRLAATVILQKRVLLAFAPTAVIGFVFYPYIKNYFLGNSLLVAAMLFFGGVAMLVFEKWYSEHRVTMRSAEELTARQALLVGFWQSVALIPGLSRSAATSIGGMVLGLDRKSTVEFSFMLAIPTMIAAGGYDLLKNWELLLDAGNVSALLVGFTSSFFCALLAVEFLLHHIQRRTFREFAWYRIIVALVMIVLLI